MNDRAWLLTNAAALACAKNCIKLIQREVGIKLSLSDTDLLSKIDAVKQNVDSEELIEAYRALLGYAGKTPRLHSEIFHNIGSSLHDAGRSLLDKIEHHGKAYPRFDEKDPELKDLDSGNAKFG